MKQENNDLTALTDLASNSFGGRVLFASDEWFAAAHNLLNPEPPVFIADKFTDFGKWMDGWESRRKRIPGHDWCIIQLGLRGKIQGFDIDTAFFTGNNAPRVSIQAAHYESDKATWPQALRELSERATEERSMGRCATQEEFALAQQICSHEWTELLPFTGSKF
jgi:allantoicase